jgi:diguanylate cyclase (GGDEF)-like protein
MLLNRSGFISALFCETDRAQRMKSTLALIQIGIDDCNDSLSQSADEIVKRIAQLLRSYDLIGELGGGMFLLALPGCDGSSAVTLAERLRTEVFRLPVRLGSREACVAACFGVVVSGGRSPLVVMHEAELAVQRAKKNGPGFVEFSTEAARSDPAAFLRPDSPPETVRR